MGINLSLIKYNEIRPPYPSLSFAQTKLPTTQFLTLVGRGHILFSPQEVHPHIRSQKCVGHCSDHSNQAFSQPHTVMCTSTSIPTLNFILVAPKPPCTSQQTRTMCNRISTKISEEKEMSINPMSIKKTPRKLKYLYESIPVILLKQELHGSIEIFLTKVYENKSIISDLVSPQKD